MRNLRGFLLESITNESLFSKWEETKKFILKKFYKDLITNKGSVTVAIYGDDSSKYMSKFKDLKKELDSNDFKSQFKKLEDSINDVIKNAIPYETEVKNRPSLGREIMFYSISDVDADMDEIWVNLCDNIKKACDKFSTEQKDINITDIDIKTDGVVRAMKEVKDIREIDIYIKYKGIDMNIVVDLYINDYIKK